MENQLTTTTEFDLLSPQSNIKLAEVLGKFIKERQLSTNIQGKQYVNVDGWQFAGSQLGIVPVLISLTDLSKEPEYKYRAEVELRRLTDDKVVGKGIALCSNKERTKKSFEEYAIASMAQTRAEGKAFRMLLSWLMKAAGFETTPTEEIIDSEEADEIGDDSRRFLQSMLENTTFDHDRKLAYSIRIDSLINWEEYNKAKTYLMAEQIQDKDRIAMGMPYNQGDIKKAAKAYNGQA